MDENVLFAARKSLGDERYKKSVTDETTPVSSSQPSTLIQQKSEQESRTRQS